MLQKNSFYAVFILDPVVKQQVFHNLKVPFQINFYKGEFLVTS